MSNEDILVVNIALYVVTLLLYLIRKSALTLGGIILSLYTFISIVAYFLFESPYSNFNSLHLFPFIYLYIVLLLLMRPILKFDERAMRDLYFTRCSWMSCLSAAIIILTMVTFLVKVHEGFSLGSLFDADQLAKNYQDSHEKLEAMESGPFMLFTALYFVIAPYIVPVFIYNILLKKKRYCIGLGLSILMSVLICLSDSSRGALLPYVAALPFIYFCFIKRLPEKVKRKVRKILVVIVGLVLFGFCSITFARFDDTSELLIYSLENYAGQSMLCFNNYGLNANGIRYGDRVAPIVRRLVGLQTSKNYYERRMTYFNMDIDDSYFITFVGDFTLDFGPVFGIVILICFAQLFSHILKLRGRRYYFSQIWILYVLFQWLIRGVFLWPFGEKTGNLALVLGFIIYYVLDRSERKSIVQTNY